MSALKQITHRAKVIRRSQGGSWRSALKKAGAEYRNKRPKKVSAVKIIEKKETRRTRPDKVVKVTRKKDGRFKKFSTVGSSGSSSHNELLLRNLNERNRNLQTAETDLIRLKKYMATLKPGIEKNNYKRLVKDQKKYMRVIKTEIRMLKGLLK